MQTPFMFEPKDPEWAKEDEEAETEDEYEGDYADPPRSMLTRSMHARFRRKHAETKK